MDNQTFFENLSRPCPVPVGARIELVASMSSDPAPIAAGTRGTVTGGNGAQVYVDWDNGRSLIMLPGVDHWRVLSDHE